MIKTQNLTKIYKTGKRSLTALDNVSINIEKGEFVAITGKSGSGKSTLLHMVGLLDNPTSGQVFIDNKDVLKLNSTQKTQYRLNNLGYVFQDYALLPTLTALENVLITIYMRGTSLSESKKMALEALTQVGLKDRANNLPNQLSGGEQQRVSIARSIVNKPLILFADEPTANLDSETSKIVLDVLQGLNNNGQTLVMVTHEPDYAKLANRILVLKDGVLTV